MAIFQNFTPEARLAMAAGVLGGSNIGTGMGQGLQNALPVMAMQKEKAEAEVVKNKTAEALKSLSPEISQAVSDGLLSPNQGYAMYLKQQQDAKEAARPDLSFQTLPDGTYGNWDKRSGQFTPLGTQPKRAEPTAIQRDLEAAGLQPGSTEYQRAILDNYRKNGGQDDYSNRQAMAEQLGMKPDDPAYRPFILTGKLPREDQQALTAVDKKAILEADEMVAVNEAAINALKQAKGVSDQANSGWGSGLRATIGANLPDIMVPDQISSPESSNATIDFDNAVVGQALTQLKAIFGGAPTEGERKILLDLQGSSNLPKEARDKILDRAIAAAERRLEFNNERATDLRGGNYYKPGRTDAQQPVTSGKTTSGNTWEALD